MAVSKKTSVYNHKARKMKEKHAKDGDERFLQELIHAMTQPIKDWDDGSRRA